MCIIIMSDCNFKGKTQISIEFIINLYQDESGSHCLPLFCSLSRIKLSDYYLRQTLIKKINLTMELLGILNMEAGFWALSVHSVRGIDKTILSSC